MDTTTNIFLWISRFFIFCLNVEGAHDIKCSQKQLELKFCWFQRLDSNFTRCSPRRCSAIFIGKHLCQSLPLRSNFIEGFSTGVFLWILQDTSGWLLLFYNICWLYTSQDFADLDFFYADIFFNFLWQMPVYFVSYAKPSHPKFTKMWFVNFCCPEGICFS